MKITDIGDAGCAVIDAVLLWFTQAKCRHDARRSTQTLEDEGRTVLTKTTCMDCGATVPPFPRDSEQLDRRAREMLAAARYDRLTP